MKKMYLVTALEYTNCIRTNIINYSICDTLDDAIKKGIFFIKEYICNIIDKDIDELTDDTYSQLVNNSDKISYSINISVFSTNRKSFKTPKDLMKYFNNNIKNISYENLYDFLLSLVEYDSRLYNYKGEYRSNMIFGRQFLLEQPYAYNLEFTEESCMNGIYEFWFK